MQNLGFDSQKLIDKHVIFSATDTKGVITEVSQAFCDISGYQKEELIGKPHNIVRHPDMSAEVFEQMWRHLHAGRTWEGDIKNRTKNGEAYWVHAKIEPLYSKNAISGFFAIRADITDKVLLERQINYIKAVLDGSKTAIATVDSRGYLNQANTYFLKKFHLQDEKVEALTIQELMQEFDENDFTKYIWQPLQDQPTLTFERMELYKNYPAKKSKTVPAQLHFTRLPGSESVVVVINIIKDQLQLKNSLKKSRIYFKKASVGFFITDKDNVILKANPKFRSMTGYKKGQLKRNHLGVLFESEAKYTHCLERISSMLQKEHNKTSVFLMKKSDGSEFWAEVSVSEFLPQERVRNEHIFWSVRDITSKIQSKRLIEEQNEKLTYLNENLKKEVQKRSMRVSRRIKCTGRNS